MLCMNECANLREHKRVSDCMKIQDINNQVAVQADALQNYDSALKGIPHGLSQTVGVRDKIKTDRMVFEWRECCDSNLEGRVILDRDSDVSRHV
jgi:hypothetical protein